MWMDMGLSTGCRLAFAQPAGRSGCRSRSALFLAISGPLWARLLLLLLFNCHFHCHLLSAVLL
jgi:hypothetical protein